MASDGRAMTQGVGTGLMYLVHAHICDAEGCRARLVEHPPIFILFMSRKRSRKFEDDGRSFGALGLTLRPTLRICRP